MMVRKYLLGVEDGRGPLKSMFQFLKMLQHYWHLFYIVFMNIIRNAQNSHCFTIDNS